MNVFANISEVIPYIIGQALDGFEIIPVRGYGGIDDITSKISQSKEKIIVNLKGYPAVRPYIDGSSVMAASFEAWIKSDMDYTSLLMLVKQAFESHGGKCGVNLNGSVYKVIPVCGDASPVRTNSGLWLKLEAVVYV